MKKRVDYFFFFKNTLFWTAIMGVGTLLLCWIAYSQLSESNRVAKEQNKIVAERFLQKLKNDFFTAEEQDMITLIEMDALRFKSITADANTKNENAQGVFVIDIPKIFRKYSPLKDSARSFYSSNAIDDRLLAHFEDLGKMYKEGMIDAANIDQDFGYYIVLCYEYPEIQKYLAWLRGDQDGKDFYKNFELIYHTIKPKS